LLGVASGAVAGLATVTRAVGLMGRFSAIIIGRFAWILCYFAVVWKGRMGYDDPLDVMGIHAVGGVFDIFAAGLFASKAINASGTDGLFFGNAGLFGVRSSCCAWWRCVS
jgi:Amt family ammonium transporter